MHRRKKRFTFRLLIRWRWYARYGQPMNWTKMALVMRSKAIYRTHLRPQWRTMKPQRNHLERLSFLSCFPSTIDSVPRCCCCYRSLDLLSNNHFVHGKGRRSISMFMSLDILMVDSMASAVVILFSANGTHWRVSIFAMVCRLPRYRSGMCLRHWRSMYFPFTSRQSFVCSLSLSLSLSQSSSLTNDWLWKMLWLTDGS